MDENTMLALKGQSLIMEMLMSMMPSALSEAWLDNVNEFNQEVVNLFAKSGTEFKLASESKEDKG